LAISFALPTNAQEQKTVDPKTRQEIEAVGMQFGEAYNKHDAAAVAALYTQDAVRVANPPA
jgi:ketosteroid isomerase-like protein